MRRFHGHRLRFAHRGRPLQGAVWLIGLGVLMLWGHWWPGILVLVGLSLVLRAAFNGSAPQPYNETERPAAPTQAPAPVPPVMTIPIPPAPVNTVHRSDLLPATCPRCGGPIRSYEVKWTGSQSAACAYCGSNLPLKKN
jgi:hypothetical protein